MQFIKLALFVMALTSQTIFSKERCGEDYGSCDDGYCCSQYNYCGDSEEHCGKGCQSEYGICKSEGGDDDFVPEAGKIEWVGFRFSVNGVKKEKNFGKVPDGDSWVGFVNKIKRNFNDDAKPTVIVIVNHITNDDTACGFFFPAPKGYSESKYILFDSSDKFEEILTKFDEEGINVWLQLEPGNNDLLKPTEITFKQYGHHSCVKGLGIDLEWWYRGDDGKGSKISDEQAKEVVDYVRSINPEYTVFVKHWNTKYMPPTYRDGLIFIDDSQGFDSLTKAKKEFKEWAETYKDNPVFFQIGYEADRELWEKRPADFAKAIAEEVTQYNKHVGIIWVDFTMKEALEKF